MKDMLGRQFQRPVVTTVPTLGNHQTRTRIKTECGQKSGVQNFNKCKQDKCLPKRYIAKSAVTPDMDVQLKNYVICLKF
jgi:hypothetical protein